MEGDVALKDLLIHRLLDPKESESNVVLSMCVNDVCDIIFYKRRQKRRKLVWINDESYESQEKNESLGLLFTLLSQDLEI